MHAPTRRQVLVTGGVGVGLVVAWALWPREFAPNLSVADGETAFDAHLKIGRDGRVAVVVPQLETGQGVLSAFAQILGDELGADWRTISVEPAPPNPVYGNPVLAAEWGPAWGGGELMVGAVPIATGGSTSVRAFEDRLRDAGAAARVLLAMEAGRRWGVPWEACEARDGFVTSGGRRLRFAELAEAAAGGDLPDPVPRRAPESGGLAGRALPRLDVPAKIDGSALFASDVRLPGMQFAAVRGGPPGSTLLGGDEAAARAVGGVRAVLTWPDLLAVVAEDGWAAEEGARAFRARWRGGRLTQPEDITRAMDAALATEGSRVHEAGDAAGVLAEGGAFAATFSQTPQHHAAPEPPAAVARFEGDRMEVWAAIAAPELARAAVARAAELPVARVTLYPTLASGGGGRQFEAAAAVQAARIAQRLGRPVSVQWSRAEDLRQAQGRPPARAKLEARLKPGGGLRAWHARIAAPDALAETAGRLRGDGADGSAAVATAGAVPPYACEHVAVDWHAPRTPIASGVWRGRSHVFSAFCTESFVDELARAAGLDPLSFRMGLLGGQPRLARVLATAAAAGGWDGGGAGSRLGLACHATAGSYAAVLAEAQVDAGQHVRVTRLVAAVDVGRAINPEGVRQQVEGGLIWGLANATAAVRREGGLPADARLGALGLPRLQDAPAITVELIADGGAPGGASEVAVPPVAPAIANALFAATGQRLRSLPLVPGA